MRAPSCIGCDREVGCLHTDACPVAGFLGAYVIQEDCVEAWPVDDRARTAPHGDKAAA